MQREERRPELGWTESMRPDPHLSPSVFDCWILVSFHIPSDFCFLSL